MGESSKVKSGSGSFSGSLSRKNSRCFMNPMPDFNADRDKLLDNPNKKRINEKYLHGIKKLMAIVDKEASDDGRDYSVYTGSSGFAMLYLQLFTKMPDDGLMKKEYLNQAKSWLKPCLKRLNNRRTSFLCGDSGPLAISAVIYHLQGEHKKSQEFISRVLSLCSLVCKDPDIPDEMLYGRCGYLSALLFIRHHIGRTAVDSQYIIEVVEAVLRSGKLLSHKEKCGDQCPLMFKWHDKLYLGAAHGLAGIYYMLLQIDEAQVQEQIRMLVRPCVDFLMKHQYPSGNGPSSLSLKGSVFSKGEDKLVQWCHGASGWVQLFSLSYQIYKDRRYFDAALKCGDVVWDRGLLIKGYGLCHGAAGNAYSFITLFKLTGDQKYLYYAHKFAEWCCDYGSHNCTTPDRPYSLFEGLAGTVYFLLDMLDPFNAAFPAYDFKSC